MRFSFKGIACIENLQGLLGLTTLKLDNNNLSVIQNIDHLVNLKELDLSFNSISKIEGVSSCGACEI